VAPRVRADSLWLPQWNFPYSNTVRIYDAGEFMAAGDNDTIKTGFVLWAVDPFTKDQKSLKAVAQVIEAVHSPQESETVPVSVLRATQLNWPAAILAPLRKQPVAIVGKALQERLQTISAAPLKEAQVLLQSKPSRLEAVQKVLQFAREQKPSMIAVSTSGASPIKSLRLGSFSEALIALSTTPVLAVGPKARAPKKIKTILFPTDFTSASRKVFKTVLLRARDLGARVIVLHVYDTSYQGLAYGSEWELGADPKIVEAAFSEAESFRREQGKSWQRVAKRLKIDCDFKMVKGPHGVSSVIIDQCEEADLIAMASYRGRVGQAILGSVARDVLTRASRPVLVVHANRR
jgi:nucleotide-binding universal stress UspA family protein